ncbi:hypothetical protein SM139_2677, partial [Stenotrophomonas maltophilia]
AWRWPPVSTWR